MNTIREKIIASAVEIFTSMVMMDITVSDIDVPEGGRWENSITGVIGLAGVYKGVLAIHVPHPVACAITGNFLGMEIDEINEDVEDAIGEIANMLGGDVKSILSENGKDIELSLPSTISGSDYGFQPVKAAEKTIIPFDTDKGCFVIEMFLEK